MFIDISILPPPEHPRHSDKFSDLFADGSVSAMGEPDDLICARSKKVHTPDLP